MVGSCSGHLRVPLWENHLRKSVGTLIHSRRTAHLSSPVTEHFLKQGFNPVINSRRKKDLGGCGNHRKLRDQRPQWPWFPYLKISFKLSKYSLAGWLSWLGHHPTPRGCGFDIWSGHVQEATDRCFSLPPPQLPSLLSSLSKISKHVLNED